MVAHRGLRIAAAVDACLARRYPSVLRCVGQGPYREAFPFWQCHRRPDAATLYALKEARERSLQLLPHDQLTIRFVVHGEAALPIHFGGPHKVLGFTNERLLRICLHRVEAVLDRILTDTFQE